MDRRMAPGIDCVKGFGKQTSFLLYVLLAQLLLAGMAAPSFAQNLVQDPSFEGGPPFSLSSSWQSTGEVDVWPDGMHGIPAVSGSLFANPYGGGGTISQDVSLAKSGKYQFQFYYAAQAGQTWALTTTVAGITVFTNSAVTNSTMQVSTSVIKLAAGSANIEFDATCIIAPSCSSGISEFGIDDVSLIFLGPNALSFAGLNKNQIAIATSINGALDAGVLTAVTGALGAAPNQKSLAVALNQLSPEVYNYGLIETLYGSQQFANDLMSCKVAGQEGASVIREGQCLWVRARARFADFDHTSNNIGAHDTTGSFSAGGQIAIAPNWRLGVAAGYDNISLTSGVAKSEGDRGNVGGVIKYIPGPLLLAAGVTGGWGSYDTDRTMAFGDFSGMAHGSDNIDYVSGQFHAAYLLQRDTWYLKPLVDVAITNVSIDGFTEHGGGGAALKVAGTSDTVVSVSPGVEIGTEATIHNFATVRPFLRAGVTWQDTDQFLLSAGFADAPDVSPFTVATKLDTVLADLSAGIDVINNGGAVLRLQYDGHYAEDTQISSIAIKASAPF
jgi:outer membrane autotransporter protein